MLSPFARIRPLHSDCSSLGTVLGEVTMLPWSSTRARKSVLEVALTNSNGSYPTANSAAEMAPVGRAGQKVTVPPLSLTLTDLLMFQRTL